MTLGGRAADFHLFNLSIHVVATLLLFGIITRACRSHGWSESAATSLAALGALLWGLHPIQTQSVTYIIQRAESMMGMFALLTLYAYVRSGDGGHPRRWQVLSVAACVLGMLSKPVMIAVPVVIWLWARVSRDGSQPSTKTAKAYFIALFATMVVGITLVLLPNESSTTVGPSAGLVSPWRYLLTQCAVIIHYLGLIGWPRGLCLDYAWPAATGIGQVWWQALLLCGLLAVAVVGVMKRSLFGFGLATFFILLSPTSSILPVADAAMEHRLYLPLACLIISGGALLARLPGKRVGSLLIPAGLALVVAYGGLTHLRNRDYQSVERMTRATLAQRPDNFRARSTLVMDLLDGGKFNEGEKEARELVTRLERGIAQEGAFAEVGGMNAEGYYPVGLNQLGRALLCLNRIPEAIAYFDRALAALPTHKEAWLNKALALHIGGNTESALEAIDEALRIDPSYGNALAARKVFLEGGRDSD